MTDIRDYLFDPQGQPISGATVTYKAMSTSEPNANPILGTTSTSPSGLWAFTGITDGNYDVYADDGVNRLIYKANSRLPYALNTASIAAGAITSDKIADGTIVSNDINLAAGISVAKLQTLAANKFVAGPVSGAAAVPVDGGRILDVLDIPPLTRKLTALGVSVSPSIASPAVGMIPDMTLGFVPPLGAYLFATITGSVSHASAGGFITISLACDAIATPPYGIILQSATAGLVVPFAMSWIWGPVVAVAVHTVTANWSTPSGTASMYGVNRNLILVELKR